MEWRDQGEQKPHTENLGRVQGRRKSWWGRGEREISGRQKIRAAGGARRPRTQEVP